METKKSLVTCFSSPLPSAIGQPCLAQHLHKLVLVVKGHLGDVVLEVGLDFVYHLALLGGAAEAEGAGGSILSGC